MKKILLVDDEPNALYVLKRTLGKGGYAIETANNGAMALKKILADKPDLLITDMQMPKMNGQDLCNAVRERYPEGDIRIIVVTARTDRELRTWAEDYDNLVFMEKPVSPRKLLDRVTALLDTAAV